MGRRISRFSQAFVLVATTLSFAALPACFESAGPATVSPDSVPTDTPTPSPTPTAGGARAAKFILKQANPQGSFDAPPTNGTAAPSGFTATRAFNADGSLLAKGTSDPNWPAWIKSFEIGISGTDNSAAKDPNCARFATSTEAGYCCPPGSTSDGTSCAPLAGTNCAAPANYFRVSEHECTAASQGTGGSSDGIFLRATFNRDPSALGLSENIMVVLEYTASGIGGAVSQPANCFKTDGSYDMNRSDGTCGSMFWQIFMKHSVSETVQPYLLLVPPTTQQSVIGGSATDMGTTTKQFFLPFGGDSALSVLQISRISAPISNATLTEKCTKYSPFCEGMVIYSVTFFRM